MSYILDALRRAQAERGRGNVPGLHTPVVSTAPSGKTPARNNHSGGGPRGAWLIAGLAAAAALALAWLQFAPRNPDVRTPVIVAQPTAPAPAAPVASSAAAEAAPEPAPKPAAAAVAEAPAPLEIDVTPPPPPPAAPKPAASAPAAAKREARSTPASAPPAVPASAPASAPAAPAQSGAPAAPIYTVANLPAAVREQLPSLQLAGITYSSNPKYRMVIVNGQVLHEGESAGPGLVLERIENARTIWAFRGYRYALP
ncbi:general secretion pathway protein GspB [Diaphorobacter aerolatus]|uniref:General secretion pathway protein GspB n=1 Tax=Diaphorobacter aerolatus TaxID=1288495 RepID=A0A7H0GP50_9BURK|nr:general secretion pathway protein GspB [Diaphorobacter aerolatus]QNP50066.1 general secretion pathway protein GspB [Diaphorobacter aerolatus]